MERVQRSAEWAARRAFAGSVSSLPGAKSLFVEAALYDARTSSALCVRAFADPAFLAEHGVREVIPFPSARCNALLRAPKPRAAVFLLRGASARGAREVVKALRARGIAPTPRCVVLVTPRASATVQRVFDAAGGPPLRVAPLPLGFLPYDADVLTLDWPAAYKELVLNGDASAILAAARGLVALADSLRLRYAPIRSAGPAAAAVAEEILETHGRRYSRLPSRSGGGGGGGGGAKSSIGSSSPAPSAAPAQRAFREPRVFSMLPPSRGDAADDTASVCESEVYAFSEADTTSDATEGTGGASGAAPTLGQLSEARQGRAEVGLVLIDRGVDIVSTLLTQWTYEGLLDEALGLGNNVLSVPVADLKTEDAAAVVRAPGGSGPETTVMTMKLKADSDSLFAQVRDLSYWAAARRIGELASGVKEYYSARPERETAEIAHVRTYVKGLREKKSEHRRASEHVALAAEISARTFECIPFKRRFEFERELIEGGTATIRKVYVAEAIARGESLEHVLRLACLWSVTSSGIDAEVFDSVRREIVASFGLRVLPLLSNLERAGMFSRAARTAAQASWLGFPGFGSGSGAPLEPDTDVSDSASVSSFRTSVTNSSMRSAAPRSPTLAPAGVPTTHSWQFARAALRLVTSFDPDEESPPSEAAAAPYLGYTPLSVRLIEAALKPDGWARLPPVAPHTALLPLGHAAVEHRAAAAPRGDNGVVTALPFDAIVVFVGGVTRAEASATRLAARAAGKRVLIAATHVVGADEFISSFSETLP